MSYDSREHMPHHEQDKQTKTVVYTDLDGTMMDAATHSFTTVQETLDKALKHHIDIVMVSSKTDAEMKHLQEGIGVYGKIPFIAENGHGIYIPEGSFDLSELSVPSPYHVTHRDAFHVIESTTNRNAAIQALQSAASQTGIPIRTFSQMSDEEFMEATGFTDKDDTRRALTRRYTEGFSIMLPREEKPVAREALQAILIESGMDLTTGGLFESVMAKGVSKGVAVSLLSDQFHRKYGKIKDVGIGDTLNDIPFLLSCDERYLVANPHTVADVPSDLHINRIPEVGPAGWNIIVGALLTHDARNT